jgi:hypothetical protein
MIHARPILRFSSSQIRILAARYQYPLDESQLLAMRPRVIERGHLRLSELKQIAQWKSPRSAGNVSANDATFVREITRFALATPCERARIESLTLLDGVRWPTASVILHLLHRDLYPILDFRALWSVSLPMPTQYDFDLWWAYVSFCRRTARATRVDMRTFDRALWQFSKENQKESPDSVKISD